MSYQSNYLELRARRDALLADGKRLGCKRGTARAVMCVETGEKWSSAAEAARKLKLHSNRIRDAIAKNGKVKVGGKMLSFQYVESEI